MVRGEITTIRLRKPKNRRGAASVPYPGRTRTIGSAKDLPLYLIRALYRDQSDDQSNPRAVAFRCLRRDGLTVWQGSVTRPVERGARRRGQRLSTSSAAARPSRRYTVEYRDQAGTPHQVVLQRPDVYVNAQIGDKIEIRYLPENPDRTARPARYRGRGFRQVRPWGVAS